MQASKWTEMLSLVHYCLHLFKCFDLFNLSLISSRFEEEADITLIGMREDGRDIENFGQKFIGVDAGGHLQVGYLFIYVDWLENLYLLKYCLSSTY